MLSLSSQKRNTEEKPSAIRKQGLIPAVLYGPKVKAASLKVDEKEFAKVYREAGESSLINLEIDKEASLVLIRAVQLEPLRGKIVHVDFYQTPLDRQIEITVPLVFEGEAPAVQEFGGTLIRNLNQIEVRALPQNLPHEIRVDISRLAAFEDKILVKDLVKNAEVQILQDPQIMVAQVVPAEDVEKELEQPVEEKVEAVEQVKEEKKEAKEEEEPEGKEKTE